MKRIKLFDADLKDGIIKNIDHNLITENVINSKNLVILKNVFSKQKIAEIRDSVVGWSLITDESQVDDFFGNYHRKRAMVSKIQQAPHVFHDYNFHRIDILENNLKNNLHYLFTPLLELYVKLTGNTVDFRIPESGPYIHPQIIQYPNGGGFFGRHSHNLMPQKLGFIVLLSEPGVDYKIGSTVFEIEDEVIEVGNYQSIGDILIWRYDYEHWVTQNDISTKFNWKNIDGRWVATLAYFDPNK
jgi:hypothetical protein